MGNFNITAVITFLLHRADCARHYYYIKTGSRVRPVYITQPTVLLTFFHYHDKTNIIKDTEDQEVHYAFVHVGIKQ
jgi:hypothetical protein